MSTAEEPTISTSFQPLDDLLDQFAALPERPPVQLTYMQIAGYPHLENVCSNVLRHFLDPDSGHGLGTVCLTSLLQMVGIGTEQLSNVQVDREVPTSRGGRVDIVVSTDELILGIEHKIFAALNNDLDDYAATLRHLAAGRSATGIVLSLHPCCVGASTFRALTYQDWIPVLLREVGAVSPYANLQQLAVLLDYIRTIQNLSSGWTMNADLLALLSHRLGDAQEFLARIDELQRELRAKVTSVAAQFSPPQDVTRAFYRERPNLVDILVHDVQWPGDQRLALDTMITPAGWEIVAFKRRGSTLNVADALEAARYKFEPWPQKPERYVLSQLRFNYSEDMAVADALKNLLYSLAEVRDRLAVQAPDVLE